MSEQSEADRAESLRSAIEYVNGQDCELSETVYAHRDSFMSGWRAALEGPDVMALREELERLRDDDYDPSPWCAACGAKSRKHCHCGPIAKND